MGDDFLLSYLPFWIVTYGLAVVGWTLHRALHDAVRRAAGQHATTSGAPSARCRPGRSRRRG